MFYIDAQDNLVAAQIDPGPTFGISERETLFGTQDFTRFAFQTTFDISSDGQRFVFIRTSESSGRGDVVLVQNWFDELKARVGN